MDEKLLAFISPNFVEQDEIFFTRFFAITCFVDKLNC